MAVIHIARDRQPLGQFSQEDVAEGLRSGRFLPTDLGWQEPMETWKPLSEFDFSSVEIPPLDEVPPVPELSLPPAPPEPAWERHEEIGYFQAVFQTIRQVFLEPAKTFRNLARTGGYLGPLMFCYAISVVCYLLSVLFATAWVYLLPARALAFYQEKSAGDFLKHQTLLVPFMLGVYLVLPFITAGVYHLALMLFAKNHGNYEVTFRTNCYLSGALALLGAMPVPPITGIFLTYVLFFVVILVTYMTIALREAHATTTAIAFLCTVLPPLFVSCCCAFAGGMGSAAATMASKGAF